MPDLIVRVFYKQLNEGVADVPFTGVEPEEAARLVLSAVDPDKEDEDEERRCRLPDGRRIEIDPEDTVAGSRVYCEVRDRAGNVIGLFGDLTSCDVTEGIPQDEEEPVASLPALLNDTEVAAILAGLRLLEERGVPSHLMGVATDEGRFEPLAPAAINGLCEELNARVRARPGAEAVAVMHRLIDHHHEMLGLEGDNDTKTRIWHLLLSLLKLGHSEGLDIGRIWQNVQAEAPTLLDDAV